MKYLAGLLFFASFMICSCTDSSSKEITPTDTVAAIEVVRNPLISANGGYSDPWVIAVNGFYYYCGSDGGGIFIIKSEKLQNIVNQPKKYIYTPTAGTDHSAELWAPELHYLSGAWYVYFAADNGSNENHRMHVLKGGSDAIDPLSGSYVYKAKLSDPDNRWAIDGSPFVYKNQLYFVWSGWPGTENVTQCLFISKMENPYTLTGNRVEVSRPSNSWETIGNPTVNEGPEVLIKDSAVHIIYSASGSWTDDYCLGKITCTDGNIMNAASWKKNGPVFARTTNVYGPGHCSFVLSPNKKQWWIVYHAAKWQGAGWNRDIRIQPFTWIGAEPYFGVPVMPGIELGVPASENLLVTNGVYVIKSKISGLNLQVSVANDTIVEQNAINSTDAQKWAFEMEDDGFFRIKNVVSGKYLQVSSMALESGARVVLAVANFNDAQRWRIDALANNTFRIANKQSLLSLSIIGGSTEPLARVRQEVLSNSTAQFFYLEKK